MAGTDAGQDQALFVQRQVEQAEYDAVDQEVEFGGPGAVGADTAVVIQERLAELPQGAGRMRNGAGAGQVCADARVAERNSRDSTKG